MVDVARDLPSNESVLSPALGDPEPVALRFTVADDAVADPTPATPRTPSDGCGELTPIAPGWIVVEPTPAAPKGELVWLTPSTPSGRFLWAAPSPPRDALAEPVPSGAFVEVLPVTPSAPSCAFAVPMLSELSGELPDTVPVLPSVLIEIFDDPFTPVPSPPSGEVTAPETVGLSALPPAFKGAEPAFCFCKRS